MASHNGYRPGRIALAIAATLAIAGCQDQLIVPGVTPTGPSGSAGAASYAPRIIRFAFDPPQVPQGASSRLTWQTQYADRVHITQLGNVAANGNRVIVPTPGLIYRITASNSNGTADAQITGSVGYAPQIIEPGRSGSDSIGTNPVGPPIIGPMPNAPGGTIGPNPVGPPIRPPVERDIRQTAPTLQAPRQQLPAATVPNTRPQLQQQQLERLQRMQEMQPLRP
jgi:hypothetical protein